MSKLITRFAIAALISLGIIAASSPNVQARLGNILQKGASDTSAYLAVNKVGMRGAGVSGHSGYFQNYDYGMDSYHDCDSDSSIDD